MEASTIYIKSEVLEEDQELQSPENESDGHLMKVKQEDENDRPKVKEDPDSPEIKYSNTQGYLDTINTATSGSRSRAPATDVKMEKIKENPDPLSGTKGPMEYFIHVKVEHETEDIPVKEIKKETEFEETEIRKGPGPSENKYSMTPVWFEVPVEKEKDSPEIKYSNAQDYLDIGETTISEPTKPETASSSKEVKSATERKNKSGEKPLKCEACDYRCSEKHILRRHMRIHTGEKPYKCDFCDFRCTQDGNLKKHMRSHTGEKPFKCVVCDRGFQSNFDLKRHMRTHSGEKPYECQACDYRCTIISSLKKHMRIHTGEKPFKCDYCDYRGTQRINLQNHMKTHTGEKPFKCDTCNYRCVQKRNLLNHMRTHKKDIRVVVE